MDGDDFIRKLFDYDFWANREALASLSTLGEATEKPLKIFSHIIGAQRIWLARFADPSPPGAQPWPALTIEECRASVEDLHQRWIVLLEGMTPEKLARDLAYRNTKGVEFKTPVHDILMHLVMHSAYHRGQVAAAVREAGGKPTPTDYVVYLRSR